MLMFKQIKQTIIKFIKIRLCMMKMNFLLHKCNDLICFSKIYWTFLYEATYNLRAQVKTQHYADSQKASPNHYFIVEKDADVLISSLWNSPHWLTWITT